MLSFGQSKKICGNLPMGKDNPDPIPGTLLMLPGPLFFLSRALRLLNQTWILASVNPVVCASSSRVYTSGYCVLANALSRASNCSPLNVVLDLRCFRFKAIPGSDSVSLTSSDPRPAEEEE